MVLCFSNQNNKILKGWLVANLELTSFLTPMVIPGQPVFMVEDAGVSGGYSGQ